MPPTLIIMKRVLFILVAFLSLGLFCACSSTNEDPVSRIGNINLKRPYTWFGDLTGYILYDQELQAWHFLTYWPYSESGPLHNLYIIELEDEYKIDGLLVTLSGDLYKDEKNDRIYIEITEIVKCSSDEEIMDRDGYFSMITEECYSGLVTDANDEEDRIKEQLKTLVSDGEEYIKVLITEAPTNLRGWLWLDPQKGKYVYFLKSELQNPDIHEGDIVDFRIVRYKMLEHRRFGSDYYTNKYFCIVEPCD